MTDPPFFVIFSAVPGRAARFPRRALYWLLWWWCRRRADMMIVGKPFSYSSLSAPWSAAQKARFAAGIH